MLLKIRSETTTNILFIVVAVSMDNIHLKKRGIWFLEPTDINSNDLFTETIYETFFPNEFPKFDAGDNPFSKNETNIQEDKLITSPADIEIH